MKLTTYDKYKDSGVEWLGEVPEHWDIQPLKQTLKEKLKYGANEAAIDTNINDPRYIRITDFGENGFLRENTFKSLTYEKAKGYFLKEGDLLFARSGATVGKTFLFKGYKGRACYAGYLIKATPNKKVIISEFLNYYTKSTVYNDWKNYSTIQATIQNISAEKYNALIVTLPTISEQTQIANYLDQATTKIDKKIELLTQKIKHYQDLKTALINRAVTKGLDDSVEMRDSGVEWIGKIPKHWEVTQMKRILNLLTDYDANGSFSTIKSNVNRVENTADQFAWFVRATDFTNYENKKPQQDFVWVDKKTYDFLRKSYLLGGEVLIAKRGEIGKVYLMPQVNIYATLGPNMYLARLNKNKVEPLYVYYFFKTTLGKNQLVLRNKSTAIGALYKDDFKSIEIYLPSKNEQQQIVEYLNQKTSTIDKIIATITAQIEHQKELRKTLINDVVTGKVKVIEMKS